MIASLDRLSSPALHQDGTPRPTESIRRPQSVTGLRDVLSAMLDEVDYPMLLITDDMVLRHANKRARAHLAEGQCLHLQGQVLRSHGDALALRRAVDASCRRGLRSLVHLRDGRGESRSDRPREGHGDGTVAVAVVPAGPHGDQAACLLMLAKPRLCEALSISAYARHHDLSVSETAVLEGLCNGRSARGIAIDRGVLLSTVRTQIGSLRTKTGAKTIGELVRDVAELPPMLNALRSPR